MTLTQPHTNLFRKEPHYIPGYTGYVPQMPFKYGQVYGSVTNKLLTDPTVQQSKSKILTQTTQHVSSLQNDTKEQIIAKKRLVGSGQSKRLTNNMIPGYTGYIPKNENYFGKRYAYQNHKAIYDLENEHNNKEIQQNKINKIINNTPGIPLQKTQPDMSPYKDKNQPIRPSTGPNSPYFLEKNHQEKQFITGYTGYIPKSRFLYSQVYKEQTRKALNNFTCEQDHLKIENKQPIQRTIEICTNKNDFPGNLNKTSANESNHIYRQQGILPKYTGHLPGHKYRYGVSFANSARMYSS